MNQKNLEFLKDQIKYTGFGETLENTLKEKMLKGENDFKINHEVKFGGDTLSAAMNFKKSTESDMYFFNSYNLKLQKESEGPALSQTFYINKEHNITLKEAYNLIEGRAVNKDLKTKDGQVYNAWLKMDFKDADTNGNFKLKQYHQNYGYDLEASLAKLPIKELQYPDTKDSLMASLKKGNVQSVNFVVDNKEQKHFVSANPHFKTVTVFDENMKRVNTRESKDQKQETNIEKSVSKEIKQKAEKETPGNNAGDEPPTKKRRQAKAI